MRIRLCLVLVSCLAAPLSAAEPVERFLAAMKARTEAFRNVRYTLTGSRQRMDTTDPERGRLTPVRAKITLDITKDRLRIDSDELLYYIDETVQKYVPFGGIGTWDGSTNRSLSPKERNFLGPKQAEFTISTGPISTEFDARYHPLFIAHGILPTVGRPLLLDRMPKPHEIEEFRVIGEVTHLGRRCIILRTEPLNSTPGMTDELWIDAEKKELLRKIVFAGKSPWCRTDIEYQDSPHGRLPKKWSLTWSLNGVVASVDKLAVMEYEVDSALSDDEFTLDPQPGMLVLAVRSPEAGSGNNPSYPASGRFLVDPSGRWVELDSKGFTKFDGTPSEDRVTLPVPNKNRWLWAIVVVLFGLVLSLYGLRRKRR